MPAKDFIDDLIALMKKHNVELASSIEDDGAETYAFEYKDHDGWYVVPLVDIEVKQHAS